MIVIWSPKAKESLKKISRYIFQTFGEKPTEKFKERVLQLEKTLATNPNIGPREPLLIHYSNNYRSVVVNIAALWDIRREPKSLIKDLEKPVEE